MDRAEKFEIWKGTCCSLDKKSRKYLPGLYIDLPYQLNLSQVFPSSDFMLNVHKTVQAFHLLLFFLFFFLFVSFVNVESTSKLFPLIVQSIALLLLISSRVMVYLVPYLTCVLIV